MEETIHDMVQQKIQEVLRACGIVECGADKFMHEVAAISRVDISMPVMDGLEASRCIRLFERDNHSRPASIVAITGAGSESARQEAFSAGIDKFLTKSVSLKVVRDIVETHKQTHG